MWGLVLFLTDSPNFIFIYISIKTHYAILHIKNAPHQIQTTTLNWFRLAVQCFKLYWNIKSYTKDMGIKRNLCIHENWLSVAITWNNQCMLQIKANKITDLKIQLPDTYVVLVWENLTKWLLVVSIYLPSQTYKSQKE